MTRHELKTWPEYFQKVIDGKKKAELRFNDRNFQIGDELLLQEYDPNYKDYTGREILVRVTDMTEGIGHLVPGHVMLSFEKITKAQDIQLQHELDKIKRWVVITGNEKDIVSVENFLSYLKTKIGKCYNSEIKLMNKLGLEVKLIEFPDHFQRCFVGIKIVK